MDHTQREALQQDPGYVAELARIRATYPPDADGFVRLEDVCVGDLNSTAQYLAIFVSGDGSTPALGADLSVRGDIDRFSSMRMKAEDVPVFLDRYKRYKRRADGPRLRASKPVAGGIGL
jgi:hypothetical protein